MRVRNPLFATPSVTTLQKIALRCAIGGVTVLSACRQDMHDQPKFLPQRGTNFYTDGRSVRPQVANTVARNQLHAHSYFDTGMIADKEGDGLPFAVTPELLARGQERYNVYCAPCHSRVGNGAGMIVQRGYAPAANFQGSRLRAVGLGHFFNVMTHGYGSMPDYAAELTPINRWAVAAYIRALQLSQKAQRADIPAGMEVKPLTVIAASEGLPESFARELDVSRSPDVLVSSSPAAFSAVVTNLPPASAKVKKMHVADIKAGQAIYAKNCQVCHTAQLTGNLPMFPSLINVVARIGAAHVRTKVQQGAPPMPAFPNLSSAELEELVAYLSDPSKSGPPASLHR